MILHQWFNENQMTSNPEKCHYIVIDSKGPSSKIMVKKKKKKEKKKLLSLIKENYQVTF